MVDLKELKKLVKYLRKEGITSFKSGDLEFQLGPQTPRIVRKSKVKESEDPIIDAIETDLPSQEELLFWSAGGMPIEQKGS